MVQRLFLFLVVSSAMLTLCSCDGRKDLFRNDLIVNRTFPGPADLQVENPGGSINIVGWDKGKLEIRAEIRATTRERAMACVLKSDVIDGRLIVKVDWPAPGREPRERCELKIKLPVGGGAVVRGSRGLIRISEMEGPLDVEAEDSRVEVKYHVGNVRVATSDENISCSEIQGSFKARNRNGFVRLIGVQNGVDIKTTNNKVEVKCFPTCQGPLNIDCEDTSIQVTVGRTFPGNVRLEVDKGSCHWELGQYARLLSSEGEKAATIGIRGTKPQSLIRSTDGEVTLFVK